MKQIRRNVFETNSSSVHSITMCLEDIYDKWMNEEVYFYDSHYKLPEGRDQFFTWDDMIEFIKDVLGADEADINALIDAKENDSSEFDELMQEYDFYTPDMYEYYNEDCDHYVKKFKTPAGETIVAFGYAGARY